MFANNHICLRALEPEDLEVLYAWENDVAEWHTGDTISPYSRDDLKRHIEVSRRSIFEESQLRLMIEQIEPKRSAGLVDLYGITIDKACRRQGLATQALHFIGRYAFELLLLHQIYAYVAAGNEASLRLFAGCGFTVAGTLRDWIAKPGGYEDVVILQQLNPKNIPPRGLS